jgi:hypothetical protein
MKQKITRYLLHNKSSTVFVNILSHDSTFNLMRRYVKLILKHFPRFLQGISCVYIPVTCSFVEEFENSVREYFVNGKFVR